MEKTLYEELYHAIDNDSLIELEIKVDENITVCIREHKHNENDGFCSTHQSLLIGKYDIDMCGAGARRILEKIEIMQKAIAELGIEQAVLTLTKEHNGGNTERMWLF